MRESKTLELQGFYVGYDPHLRAREVYCAHIYLFCTPPPGGGGVLA